MSKELESSVLNVISKLLGREVSLEDEIQNIPEWDSLKHLQIVLEIEDAFKVKIPTEKVSEIKSVKDLVLLVEDLLK